MQDLQQLYNLSTVVQQLEKEVASLKKENELLKDVLWKTIINLQDNSSSLYDDSLYQRLQERLN